MAWSPYKQTVINFVRENPGCNKYAVAKHVTRSGRRDPSKQYYIVNTAIRNKWIKAVRNANQFALFVE